MTESADTAATASEPSESGDPGQILVVDDNRLNRLKLGRALKQQGHAVSEAEDGREALEMLRSHSFVLVLLDILMPVVDGFQVLREMKDDTDLRDIPVIVISGLEDMESVNKCLVMGADDFLNKPVEPAVLKDCVQKIIEKETQ